MSSFTSSLIVTPMPDGKTWRLDRAFTYHLGSRNGWEYIRVPKGFKSDFASVPKLLLLVLPSWAKYSKAPILHDWLYHYKRTNKRYITRKEADQIFLEAMKVDWRGHKYLRPFIAYLEYIAVRLFGGIVWKE